MKSIIALLIALNLSAGISHSDSIPKIVNKTQVCDVYYSSFIMSADLFQETKSCYDVKYAALSFAQLVLSNCDLDDGDFEIAEYIQQLENQCKNDKANSSN